MSNENNYSYEQDSYEQDSAPRRVRAAANGATSRNAASRRRAKAPKSINGMHRRRRRKIAW